MITTSSLPAVLGGSPVFETPLRIVRPVLPPLRTISERLDQAMKSGALTNHGPHVQRFERAMEERLGVPNFIAVGNGTVGLMILARAIKVLHSGKRHEIVLPSFSFSATAHAVVWAGLTPVFCDIDPKTYTLDPEKAREMVTESTLAVMGVHIFGHPCSISQFDSLASETCRPVIFDAAHAFGSSFRGVPIGNFGDAEVFSFHATKVFPVGEGGGITTRNDELASLVRKLRAFGDQDQAGTLLPGLNGKMQEFNALIGLENLELVEGWILVRRRSVAIVKEVLQDVDGIYFQRELDEVSTNCQNLSIMIDPGEFGLGRDALLSALWAENIHGRRYFWPPLHRHPAYASTSGCVRSQLPHTDNVSDSVICLPLSSDMRPDEAAGIGEGIRRIQAFAEHIVEQSGEMPVTVKDQPEVR